MLRFSVRMMISDISTAFKGLFIWIYYGLLFAVLAIPFYVDKPYYLYYITVLLLSFLTPQLPKLFYVLPFGSIYIRRYLHIRGLLNTILILSVGAAVAMLSPIYSTPFYEQGWRFICFYAQVSLLLGLIHVKLHGKHKTAITTIIFLLIASNFINVFFTSNFLLHLGISIGFVIASELLLCLGLRAYTLSNYAGSATNWYWGLYNNPQQKNKEGGQVT